MGLAFDSQASIELTTGQPLIKSLASHLPEESRYFAVGLSRLDSGSSFTIGELDPEYANFTEEFAWSDVYVNPGKGQTYDYWKVPLKGISINGTFLEPLSESKILDSPSPIAILDTGTTLMLGPAVDVQYFWKTVGGSRQNSDGQWQVLCNRGVVVKVTLGENGTESEYVIHPGDVNWMDGGKEEDASGKWCSGGIQANDYVSLMRLDIPQAILIGRCVGEFWRLAARRYLPPCPSSIISSKTTLANELLECAERLHGAQARNLLLTAPARALVDR